MRFTFCPDCGARLTDRQLGDEGKVAWCEVCAKPWFEIFSAAAIALVYDECGRVLLLKQSYISTKFHNLVSGYIKPGESAESTAIREIFEETGQKVEELQLKLTHWFPKKELLMIGFFARVKALPLRLSSEVDSASWHDPQEVLSLLSDSPHSAARRLAELFLKTQLSNTTT
ncbi:MAG: NUDIX domain-containing protein [Bacteroidales bacterium]|nr:NUDIX domain-containing protein [Bacteroidales bacterium]